MTNWIEKYPNNIVDLNILKIHSSWKPFFNLPNVKIEIEKLNKFFTNLLTNQKTIFPYPDNIFNAFKYTPVNKIKVIIIGQDPYPNSNMVYGIKIPEAMGLSFSVPENVKIPSSLNNILKNAIKYKHFFKYPNHGNLEF